MFKRLGENIPEEEVQRAAWKLVRAAEDRIKGQKRGAERLAWCVDKLKREYPNINGEHEDHVRAAFVNFKIS